MLCIKCCFISSLKYVKYSLLFNYNSSILEITREHKWLRSNKDFSLDNKMCVNLKYYANWAQVCGHICSCIYNKVTAKKYVLIDEILPQEMNNVYALK